MNLKKVSPFPSLPPYDDVEGRKADELIYARLRELHGTDREWSDTGNEQKLRTEDDRAAMLRPGLLALRDHDHSWVRSASARTTSSLSR
jgi:hypothetical protein